MTIRTKQGRVPLAESGMADGCEVQSDIADQLRRYRDLILEWNRKFNLTAIRDPEEIDRRLVGDSLRLLPAIDDFIAHLAFDGDLAGIDIGSGAGIPGIPVAIARPEIHMTLVEATGKKASFLELALKELKLARVEVLHGRSEEIAHNPMYREQFDLAMARAVTGLPALAEIVLPLLRTGGRAFLPKGEAISAELQQGRKAATLLGGAVRSHDRLPETAGMPVTRMVILDKIESTSNRYPRRAGIPEHEPLGE